MSEFLFFISSWRPDSAGTGRSAILRDTMSDHAGPTGRIYGLIQSVLLCGFTLVYFADRSVWLFRSALAGLVGGVLCFAGILLMVAALAVIRRSIQIAPAPRADAQLVTTGVYAWFRHPIYTAIVMLLVGLFFRQPTAWVALAGTIVIAYLMLKVRIEERLLRARYPDYAAYTKRTFGLLPWWR